MPIDNDQPYIPASNTSLPEFTVRAVILGAFLGFIMTAANIYIALYAGMTVSTAIPASVISMGVLRGLLRRGTILENNVVHTVASAGSSLAAGTVFTIPALLLLTRQNPEIGWTTIKYWETTMIAMAGGLMGVVMMIPLRRPMIIEQKQLRFPEGVACAEVLKAGDRGGAEMWGIVSALVLGGVFKLLVALVGVFKGTVGVAVRVGQTGVMAATEISPMLMGVGYICGLEISALVFLGGAISFLGALPILAWDADLSGDLTEALGRVWGSRVRFFGIGAMVVAGVYSIIKIAPSIWSALRTAVRGFRGGDRTEVLRTDRDITGKTLLTLLLVGLGLSACVYFVMTGSAFTTAVTAVSLFVLAFFFVAVASYIVGLVGSSNSPISGMTICAVLVTAGLLLALGHHGAAGMLATLGVAGVVCCAASTAGDVCQDLKMGQIVGGTPRALQAGEIIGSVLPAFIVAPTMMLLISAYGIGERGLKAPQAHLFANLVGGIFDARTPIPWHLVGWGAAVAVIAILIDHFYLEPRKAKFRLYAMPLAVGMYLPWETSFPILLGGIAYWYVERRTIRRRDTPEAQQAAIHRGLLFASGLVAGEAILGIVNAGLVVGGLGGPWLPAAWSAGSGLVDVVSLAALLAMTWLLIRRSLG